MIFDLFNIIHYDRMLGVLRIFPATFTVSDSNTINQSELSAQYFHYFMHSLGNEIPLPIYFIGLGSLKNPFVIAFVHYRNERGSE